MKEQLLQIKQDIIDISNDLKTNLSGKGVTADGTLSELVDKVNDVSGGSDSLSEIGWNLSEQPYLKDAIDYAKEILAKPSYNYLYISQLVIFPKVDELELSSNMFNQSNLAFFPDGVKLTGTLSSAFCNTPIQHLDLTKLEGITDMQNAFQNCQNLVTLETNENFGVGITAMQQAFNNCKKLKSPITLNVSSCTSMQNTFYECNSIPSITLVGDPSKLTYTQNICRRCSSLTYLSVPEDFPLTGGAYEYGHLEGIQVPKIYGSFDYSRATSYGSTYYNWVTGFSQNKYTRYQLIKNLGYYQTGSYLNMEYSQVWGIANDEVPDARQSLIDSLITYSFDRAGAGYSTMTMKLYTDVKALLTEDEIAQITAKGYTLV